MPTLRGLRRKDLRRLANNPGCIRIALPCICEIRIIGRARDLARLVVLVHEPQSPLFQLAATGRVTYSTGERKRAKIIRAGSQETSQEDWNKRGKGMESVECLDA